jgi:hypothetical protein
MGLMMSFALAVAVGIAMAATPLVSGSNQCKQWSGASLPLCLL